MYPLECTIFNVDHGFSAFVRSPNGYGLLIDFGSRQSFSPVKWIRANYNAGNQNITLFERRRIATAIVTHLHLDHFDDIGNLVRDKPRRLLRDKETLRLLAKKAREEQDARRKGTMQEFVRFQEEYNNDPDSKIDWGCKLSWRQLSYADADGVSKSDDNLINNRSFVITIEHAGKKILIPGDMEVEGWEKVIEDSSFQELLAGTNFFVAAHHGHKSGFTSKILDHTGIPDVYLVSARQGDEHIDTAYSDENNSKGFLVDGDRSRSRMISTRHRGTIKITIPDDGRASICTMETSDNLSQHQQKLAQRRKRSQLDSLGY